MATSSNLLDEALGIFDNNLSSSSSSSSSNGSVVMIQDCVETSGIFVIHHLLKRSLSSPAHHSSVIFLSLSHPFSHYDRILRKLGCSLVALNHEDIYSGKNSSSLLLQMEYLANILIKVEPLATGLAADVHGQLTSLNKRIHDQSKISSNKIQNFHFKLKENGVECFYPGSQT